MGISKDSDYETRIGPTPSHVTISVPDEFSRLNQPLLTPLPRANPNPLDAITIVPVELAKVESRYGIILSLIAFTLIPAFFESIYHTTSHVKPLIVIFAVTSYVSLLVTAWHKTRFLREEPDDIEMVYTFTGFFILEVSGFSILIAIESLTIPSVPYAFEICWTVLGFVVTSCVLLKVKFYG